MINLFLTSVYVDCVAFDQVLDVGEKHRVVKLHSGGTYKKVEVKKVGYPDNPTRFFAMLTYMV